MSDCFHNALQMLWINIIFVLNNSKRLNHCIKTVMALYHIYTYIYLPLQLSPS